ncbi:MAG: hypothetical protein ACXWKP_06620 [Bradyrhizobium sp.]
MATFALCIGLLVQVAIAADSGASGDSQTKWGGLSWGIGLAADFDVSGKRVNNSTVVNNIVRATDTSNNVGVSFVLEAHYFFKARELGQRTSCLSNGAFDWINCSIVATGPFVAIEIGGGATSATGAGGPVTGYALGWMVGLQHPTALPKSTSSWNFGVGLRVDPKSQVLGDGLVVNQPLPVGDSIRFKTEPRFGLMLLSSFSF